MSYLFQSKLAADTALKERVTACAATEGIENPSGWVFDNSWALSTQPGWVEAYKKSVNAGSKEPGADEDTITDAMVLSAVQSLAAPTDSDPAE